jgi:hypothetical protein
MNLPEELKPDLHRTLLGPLGLANDLFGALLPGSIFTILLLLKGRLAGTLLSYSFLGYKTKVVCGLLASYLFGKVSLSAVTLVDEIARSALNKKMRTTARQEIKGKKSTALLELADYLAGASGQVRSFVSGLAGGPFMLGKSRAYEYYAAYTADSLFHLSAGLLFLAAAAISGDGNFRYLEAAIGLVLFARGLRSSWIRVSFMAGLMGMMAGNAVSGMQPDQVAKGLMVAAGILNRLGQPFPPVQPGVPSETSAPPAEAEIAENSAKN